MPSRSGLSSVIQTGKQPLSLGSQAVRLYCSSIRPMRHGVPHWCSRPPPTDRYNLLVSLRVHSTTLRPGGALSRESFLGLREGYLATCKWTDGFPLFCCFDHKNIERAEAVMKSRKAARKLLAWVADNQVMLHRLVRIWIEGKEHVIADAGSRAPWYEVVAKRLPLPIQPVLDTIRQMFTHPDELAARTEARRKDLGLERF